MLAIFTILKSLMSNAYSDCYPSTLEKEGMSSSGKCALLYSGLRSHEHMISLSFMERGDGAGWGGGLK